ncbi:hypothetical protein [Desulfohalovibrio reitneri]|jgi:hypothetical protein|nr:hypothetical protein [Desulfohalovibrio reitneri]
MSCKATIGSATSAKQFLGSFTRSLRRTEHRRSGDTGKPEAPSSQRANTP